MKKPKKSKPPKGVPPRIWALALDLFEDNAKIRRWFRKKNRALGGKTPMSFIKAGRSEEIEAIFIRIAHGVFS